MNEETIFTLSEFIDIFGGIEQIHSIYVDSDDDEIRAQLQGNPRPLDILHNYNNIMIDDEYLVLRSGEYVLDKEKLFKAYGNYYISMYFPIIPPEYVQEANDLARNSTDREYLGYIAKYSDGVEILIKKTLDFNLRLEKAFNPDIHSNINGYLILDYCKLPDELTRMTDLFPPIITTPVAVVENEAEMLDVVRQRITLGSMVYKFNNGILQNCILYQTDKDGNINQLVDKNSLNKSEDDGENYD